MMPEMKLSVVSEVCVMPKELDLQLRVGISTSISALLFSSARHSVLSLSYQYRHPTLFESPQ
jgi:hypothetical protein